MSLESIFAGNSGVKDGDQAAKGIIIPLVEHHVALIFFFFFFFQCFSFAQPPSLRGQSPAVPVKGVVSGNSGHFNPQVG